MPSLRELQQAFADAVLDAHASAADFVAGGADLARERLAIYRNTIFANYRRALTATFPVVKGLLGSPSFDDAVDAFVRAHPSASGDLNVYGDAFAAFLAGDARAAGLPHLPDIARLEWAIDEAHRAADGAPQDVLAAIAATPAERSPALRLRLDPSCRLVASAHPLWRLWRVHRDGDAAAPPVAPDDGRGMLLVRRDAQGVSVEPLPPGEFAWLAALAQRSTLGEAIDAARQAEPAFDLGRALAAHIASGTIVAVEAA